MVGKRGESAFEEDGQAAAVAALEGLFCVGEELFVGEGGEGGDPLFDVLEVGSFLEGEKIPKGAFIFEVAEARFEGMDGSGFEGVEALGRDGFCLDEFFEEEFKAVEKIFGIVGIGLD